MEGRSLGKDRVLGTQINKKIKIQKLPLVTTDPSVTTRDFFLLGLSCRESTWRRKKKNFIFFSFSHLLTIRLLMDRSLPLLLWLLLLVWSCCFIDLVSCQNGRLEQLVKTENIFVHLNEFQRIADRPENKGSRAINYGYNQSVDYVVEQLETHTDLVVSVQLFPATISQYTEEPILELLEPTYAKYFFFSSFF